MRFFLAVVCVLCGLGLAAAEGDAAMRQDAPRRPRSSFFWRAFSAMNETERAELMKLQRQNPEEYQKRIAEIAERQRVAFQKEVDAQKKLIADYRAAGDDAEKAKIKAELEKHVRREFTKILQDNRRMLTDMEKRVEHLRGEIKMREEKADEAVAAALNAFLSGEAVPGTPPPRPPEEPGRRGQQPGAKK